MDTKQELVVTARPIRSSWIAVGGAVLLFAVFLVVALVMRRDNDGVIFDTKDQVGTAVLGLILAAAALIPTRPRLRADIHGVQTRAYLGSPRFIPWDLVLGVDFPQKLRFARLLLPGDETLALYAVQRMDRERSVAVMHGLRQLYAQSRSA